MEKAITSGKMADNTTESGRRGKCTDRVYLLGKMDANILAATRTI